MYISRNRYNLISLSFMYTLFRRLIFTVLITSDLKFIPRMYVWRVTCLSRSQPRDCATSSNHNCVNNGQNATKLHMNLLHRPYVQVHPSVFTLYSRERERACIHTRSLVSGVVKSATLPKLLLSKHSGSR